MKKDTSSIYFFGLIFLIVDQFIKIFLTNNMVLHQSFILIKNFLNITLVYNTGAAFSILNGNKLLLIGIGIAALIFLIYYIKSLEVINDFDIFTYSLLLGGILGNLIDRIVHGYVIDYLSFNFGNFYFPIFNFADVCIVLAVVLISINTIKGDLWK